MSDLRPIFLAGAAVLAIILLASAVVLAVDVEFRVVNESAELLPPFSFQKTFIDASVGVAMVVMVGEICHVAYRNAI